jgi:alpha-beta hydrolase superfamily lysophospholipase
MTRLTFNDQLLDAQLVRVAGSAPYGGAELGECLATASRIKERDLLSWFDEWSKTAESAARLGELHASRGDTESARLAFLRASNYHRNAGVMLYGTPLNPRLVESNTRQTDAFRRACELMPIPPQVIEIPYEQTVLPGYFFAAAGDARPRPTVILTGGYDGTCEELYLWNGVAALARGYNVLAFDGPGQGAPLLQHGMPIRADWEAVVSPVVDYATGRPDVAADQLALLGLSLGAHLAPRAASAEHRLAACLADCGSYDLYASFLSRLPRPLAVRFDAGKRGARRLVSAILERMMQKPTAGWVLRRGLLVHGAETPLELIDAMREFSLAGRAERITCPTWVCNAEGDDISESARQLVDALRCPHEFVTFTADEGGGDHCVAAARTLYHARSFGWLGGVLGTA